MRTLGLAGSMAAAEASTGHMELSPSPIAKAFGVAGLGPQPALVRVHEWVDGSTPTAPASTRLAGELGDVLATSRSSLEPAFDMLARWGPGTT
jgi:hypothetical protein